MEMRRDRELNFYSQMIRAGEELVEKQEKERAGDSQMVKVGAERETAAEEKGQKDTSLEEKEKGKEK
jgi:hypothetical protein